MGQPPNDQADERRGDPESHGVTHALSHARPHHRGMNATNNKNLKTIELTDLAVSAPSVEQVKGGAERREVTREEWERIVAQMIKDANKK